MKRFARKLFGLNNGRLRAPPRLNVLYHRSSDPNTLVNSLGEGRLALGALLGGGSFGNVYKAKTMHDNEDVAVKMGGYDTELTTVNMHETMAFRALSMKPTCPPVVVCAEAILVERDMPIYVKQREGDAHPRWRYGIVMELMDGDLNKLASVIKDGVADPEQKYYWLMYITLGMAYALNYIHASGWAHNDVKPANFLYSWPAGAIQPRIKIGDLGLACTANVQQNSVTWLVDAYRAATKFRIPNPDSSYSACGYDTTSLYAKPGWGEGAPAENFAENYANDRYEFMMTAKILFIKMEFGLPGAWVPGTYEELMSRRDLIRSSDLPYEFLRGPLRGIAQGFSDNLRALAADTITTAQATENIAILVEQAGLLR